MESAGVERLVGVYDADGSLRGEVAYWIGARLGRRHCALCDITHGAVRERRDWKECKLGLPVPFDTFHRDDQPPAVRELTGGAAPVVVADTTGGWVLLLDGAALAACEGSPALLLEAIEAAVGRLGLQWVACT